MEQQQEQHRHIAGSLRQSNKLHKTGRHRSKRSISNDAGRKLMYTVKAITKRHVKQLTKAERRSQSVDRRKKQREAVLQSKRCRGLYDSAPFLVGVASLTLHVDIPKIMDLLLSAYPSSKVTRCGDCIHLVLPSFQRRISFVVLPDCDLFGILEFAKSADFLLLLSQIDQEFSEFAEHAFSCLCAQGLPNIIYALCGTESLHLKKKNEAKNSLLKILSKRFPKLDKLFVLDTASEAQLVIRCIMTQKLNMLKFRESRSSLVAESITVIPNSDVDSLCSLRMKGFVRSKPLSANAIVHLPNLGGFHLKYIKKCATPGDVVFGDREEEVEYPDEHQVPLTSEAEVDPMDAEQTWPEEGEGEDSGDGSDGDEDEDDDDDDDEGEEMESSGDEAASGIGDDASEASALDMKSVTFSTAPDEEYNYEEHNREKAARNFAQFPDEVDTPVDRPARERFQKYRGLQSFKHAPWDPLENLPSDYSRIFTFENIIRTRKSALNSTCSGIAQPGVYVEVEIENVPASYCSSLPEGRPLVIFALLEHEHKMTVCNFLLSRHPGSTDIEIKSKDELIFWTGIRSFTARPIFSEHTTGNKHRFLRYFLPEQRAIATCICPVTWGACPVLVFRKGVDDVCSLVATGTLHSIDPLRVVVKRAVLSGYPYKIHKRTVVARYMFHNREDIQWFKPVQLSTKWGRRGHIIEPLGTHGYMKCKFDGMIKSQDTILMKLYKRVFPKWHCETQINEFGIDIPESVISASIKSHED